MRTFIGTAFEYPRKIGASFLASTVLPVMQPVSPFPKRVVRFMMAVILALPMASAAVAANPAVANATSVCYYGPQYQITTWNYDLYSNYGVTLSSTETYTLGYNCSGYPLVYYVSHLHQAMTVN